MFLNRPPARLTAFLSLALLCACRPSYAPDTYSGNAVQQANKVDQGIVVGVRAVKISADTTLAAATGAAAGGIAGSQLGNGTASALGALGGSVAGGVVGNVVSHATEDTDAFEYIVRKPNGELLSVTQKDLLPLDLGAHVLIIEGAQARIVIDYTVPIEAKPGDAKPVDLKPGEPRPAAVAEPPKPTPPQPSEAKPESPSPTAAPAPEAPKLQGAPGAPAEPAPSGS